MAPNSPVSTRVPVPAPRSRSSATNRSYKGIATSGGAASMKLGRRPLPASPYSVNCDTTSTAPCTSASARFILPAGSLNKRNPRILSAIQERRSSVSSGANPASTRNPAPIFPVTFPATRTSARETRWSTTLTGPPHPSAERGMRSAECQDWGRTPRLRFDASHSTPHSALRIPHLSALRTPHSALVSFHGHTLREIARLIDVAPPAHGDVIRQELQRQH